MATTTAWTQPSQSGVTVSCNAVDYSFPAVSAGSGSITSPAHTWSNTDTSAETANCHIIGAGTYLTPASDCPNAAISTATPVTPPYTCSGAQRAVYYYTGLGVWEATYERNRTPTFAFASQTETGCI